jgi:hypothetical protein
MVTSASPDFPASPGRSANATGSDTGRRRPNLSFTPNLQPPRTRGATLVAQDAGMKRDPHHQNAGAFAEKGETVQTSADRQDYVDFLRDIPTFSSCTRNVLKEFVTLDMIKVGCAAGEVLSEIHLDQNLYVLVAGSAILDAGDDVLIALEPGDYFGPISARRYLLVSSVLAVSDIELIVISPDEVTQLEQASARDRHPSEIPWRIELPTTTKRESRRNHRRSVLASQGVR